MPATKLKSEWGGGELRFREKTNSRVLANKMGPGGNAVAIATDTTLAITHCGQDVYVTADATVITLPATVVGYYYRIINGCADGTALIKVSPNSSDLIAGGGYTAADDKDLLNTKATAKEGDYVELVGNGTTGWNIVRMVGVWAYEGA